MDEQRANEIIDTFSSEMFGAEQCGLSTAQAAEGLATRIELLSISDEDKVALRKVLGVVWEIHESATDDE
jgi:hypothetical protein